MIFWYEQIKRSYSNGVKIIYENIDNENIYIHSIVSSLKKIGYGTECLNSFLKEFNNKNIYLFSSSELGTDKNILDKWYESLGFKKSKNIASIPYNITHFKSKSQEI